MEPVLEFQAPALAVTPEQNRRQKFFNRGALRLFREAWHSEIWQKLNRFTALHISIFWDLELCLGGLEWRRDYSRHLNVLAPAAEGFGKLQTEHQYIICATRLLHTLELKNWNQNFRLQLRLYHLNVFDSGSNHPKYSLNSGSTALHLWLWSIWSIILVEQCVNCQTKEAVSHYWKSITSSFLSITECYEKRKTCKRFRYLKYNVDHYFEK